MHSVVVCHIKFIEYHSDAKIMFKGSKKKQIDLFSSFIGFEIFFETFGVA